MLTWLTTHGAAFAVVLPLLAAAICAVLPSVRKLAWIITLLVASAVLGAALIVPTVGSAAQASRAMRRRIGQHLDTQAPGTTSLLREQYLQDLSPLERWIETLPLVARLSAAVPAVGTISATASRMTALATIPMKTSASVPVMSLPW